MTADRVEQRIVEASARLGGRGAVTGWAALRMHGAGYFDGLARDGRTRLPVGLVAGTSRVAESTDAAVTRAALSESEVVERYGVRVTSIERAVLDELRWQAADLRAMVVVMDMAAAARLTSLKRLRQHFRSARGVPEAGWQALRLADEHSLSPQESRLRLVWVLDAELPPPVCNVPVYCTRTASFIGMPDLLEPDTGMTGEYDGAMHRTAARHRADTARLDRFADAGLETCVVVGSDVYDVDRAVARLRATYARAGRRPATWVAGDHPGPTLDQELDRQDR